MSEETEAKKRPAFQFYPGDWRKDVELRACSLAARGLWIDLMCVMHDCEPYGHLVLNGAPMTPAKIAGQIGVTPQQVKKLLDELIENGVARKTADGTIFSKRMVDDERLRNARATGGKAGSEHGIKGAEHGIKGGRPVTSKGGSETPLPPSPKPPPSSSSSSSSSESASHSARTRSTTSIEVFPMERDWAPSEGFTATAKMAGLPVLNQAFMDSGQAEFVSYWLTRPNIAKTQAEWEHAMVHSLKRAAANSKPPKPETAEAKPWDDAI